MVTEIDKVTLIKHRLFQSASALDEYLYDNLDIEVIADEVLNSHIAIFKNALWTDKSSIRYKVIKTPTNAWQHFKLDYFPEWLLKRFPVDYTTYEIEYAVTFPEYVPPADYLGRASVQYIVNKDRYQVSNWGEEL